MHRIMASFPRNLEDAVAPHLMHEVVSPQCDLLAVVPDAAWVAREGEAALGLHETQLSHGRGQCMAE